MDKLHAVTTLAEGDAVRSQGGASKSLPESLDGI